MGPYNYRKNENSNFSKSATKNNKLNEAKIAKLLTEELKKSDVIDIIKKDKDFENRVKEIVRAIVKDMYRILYQHNGIFTALGKS